MNKNTDKEKQTNSVDSRKDRLKLALKANMAKRKSQARARKETVKK